MRIRKEEKRDAQIQGEIPSSNRTRKRIIGVLVIIIAICGWWYQCQNEDYGYTYRITSNPWLFYLWTLPSPFVYFPIGIGLLTNRI